MRVKSKRTELTRFSAQRAQELSGNGIGFEWRGILRAFQAAGFCGSEPRGTIVLGFRIQVLRETGRDALALQAAYGQDKNFIVPIHTQSIARFDIFPGLFTGAVVEQDFSAGDGLRGQTAGFEKSRRP